MLLGLTLRTSCRFRCPGVCKTSTPRGLYSSSLGMLSWPRASFPCYCFYSFAYKHLISRLLEPGRCCPHFRNLSDELGDDFFCTVFIPWCCSCSGMSCLSFTGCSAASLKQASVYTTLSSGSHSPARAVWSSARNAALPLLPYNSQEMTLCPLKCQNWQKIRRQVLNAADMGDQYIGKKVFEVQFLF